MTFYISFLIKIFIQYLYLSCISPQGINLIYINNDEFTNSCTHCFQTLQRFYDLLLNRG